jgi:DNA-binding SARP family transcriptional activator
VCSLGGYRLTVAPEQVDVAVFDRLAKECLAQGDAAPAQAIELGERCTSLWYGPVFANAPEGGLRRCAAMRLEEQRLLVVATLARAHLRRRSSEKVVPWLRAELAGRPGWEPGCGLLMEALYRSGRRADALDVYHRTRVWLRHHHGLDPEPGLRALSLQILRGEPLLDPLGAA